jgi:hypothetical protein
VEFESTLKEDRPVVETVVVYDKDGRIFHVHDFIGDGTGLTDSKARAVRERITMYDAKGFANAPKGLKALHLERGFTPAPGTAYRVDVAKVKLAVQRPKAVGAGSMKGRARAK